MGRRRFALLVCLASIVIAAATAGAAQPVKIDKTRTNFKHIQWASDLCAVIVATEGPNYEITGCGRPLYVEQLEAFQVRVPRATSVHFSGVVNAQGCNRGTEIDMKVILLVDGKRIGTAVVHVPRSKKAADFPIARLARLAKGKHWIEFSIQPTEEEGLVGLCVNEATLSAKAP